VYYEKYYGINGGFFSKVHLKSNSFY